MDIPLNITAHLNASWRPRISGKCI